MYIKTSLSLYRTRFFEIRTNFGPLRVERYSASVEGWRVRSSAASVGVSNRSVELGTTVWMDLAVEAIDIDLCDLDFYGIDVGPITGVGGVSSVTPGPGGYFRDTISLA